MSIVSRHHTHITHDTITRDVANGLLGCVKNSISSVRDEGLLKLLQIDEMLVVSIHLHQFVVLATLYYLAIVNDAYKVGIANGG